MLALYATLLAGVATVRTAPSAMTAIAYLSNYGYLRPSLINQEGKNNLISWGTVSEAISEFQSFAGLNITGKLDTETLMKISLPRCGIKDKISVSSDFRRKRYALSGSVWLLKNLTYNISKYPSRLSEAFVDEEVRQALSMWSDYTDLVFTPQSSESDFVHIDIRWESGEHGDGDPFDGPNGVIAHAFDPSGYSKTHFDDSEDWTINSTSGINLKQVAAHEFGHALGLSHSDVSAAVMQPFYVMYQPHFLLHEDDVSGIQALYGPKSADTVSDSAGTSITRGSTEVPSEEDAEPADLCTDNKVDTIFASADGNTYALKGKHFWKLVSYHIPPGYPQRISERWPGLPGDVDAAFTYKGREYFFKGSQMWRYTDRMMDSEYPIPIAEGFPGVPDNLDVALVGRFTKDIYFFKSDKFWRYDLSTSPHVDNTYPVPIANWEGVPNDLDAALQSTFDFTYFFKGSQYYRFNLQTSAVDVADPPFPRPTGLWWFGCLSAKEDNALRYVTSDEPQDFPGFLQFRDMQ